MAATSEQESTGQQALTVMVLHFAAVTPAHLCKEMGVLDLSPKAAFPRFRDSCVELMNRPCRKQSDRV